MNILPLKFYKCFEKSKAKIVSKKPKRVVAKIKSNVENKQSKRSRTPIVFRK